MERVHATQLWLKMRFTANYHRGLEVKSFRLRFVCVPYPVKLISPERSDSGACWHIRRVPIL